MIHDIDTFSDFNIKPAWIDASPSFLQIFRPITIASAYNTIMAPTSIKLIAGSSHLQLANQIAQRLCIESTPIEIVHYSNQKRSITIKDDIRDEDIFILQSTTAKVDDSLMELLQIIHACRAARAQRITAILPNYHTHAKTKRVEATVRWSQGQQNWWQSCSKLQAATT